MKKNRIGKTVLTVTELGFGGAPLGNLYHAVEDGLARATLDAGWDAGSRYFDTAPFYGYGLSERRFGEALRSRDRKEFLLSTKVGRIIRPGWDASKDKEVFAATPPFYAAFDYSYDGVMRSIEDSYQRLGMDRIDLVFIHDIGAVTHGDDRHADLMRTAMEGGFRALDSLRAAGTIGALGLGVNEWEVCYEAMREGDFDCFLLAGRYTLLEQGSLDTFLPACEARGISIIIGGPFNSGVLAKEPTEQATYNYAPVPDAVGVRVEALRQVCERHRVPLAAAALQFPLAHPAVVSVIPGARSPDEVKTNKQLLDQVIPTDLWAELKTEGLLPEAAPVPR